MFLYIFCALILLGAISFVYALVFPGPVHQFPEGFVPPSEPFKPLPDTDEVYASDPLEDISYSSWKQNTFKNLN